MSKPLMSKQKSEILSNCVFLLGLTILLYTGAWWPGILLALWATLALRQYLTGLMYDVIVTSVLLIGLFVVSFFQIDWNVLMPILFVLGGIYIIFREAYFSGDTNGEDKAKEIEEDVDINITEPK